MLPRFPVQQAQDSNRSSGNKTGPADMLKSTGWLPGSGDAPSSQETEKVQ